MITDHPANSTIKKIMLIEKNLSGATNLCNISSDTMKYIKRAIETKKQTNSTSLAVMFRIKRAQPSIF